jgi:hypothetical protein
MFRDELVRFDDKAIQSIVIAERCVRILSISIKYDDFRITSYQPHRYFPTIDEGASDASPHTWAMALADEEAEGRSCSGAA